jgi:hypothetical protein
LAFIEKKRGARQQAQGVRQKDEHSAVSYELLFRCGVA